MKKRSGFSRNPLRFFNFPPRNRKNLPVIQPQFGIRKKDWSASIPACAPVLTQTDVIYKNLRHNRKKLPHNRENLLHNLKKLLHNLEKLLHNLENLPHNSRNLLRNLENLPHNLENLLHNRGDMLRFCGNMLRFFGNMLRFSRKMSGFAVETNRFGQKLLHYGGFYNRATSRFKLKAAITVFAKKTRQTIRLSDGKDWKKPDLEFYLTNSILRFSSRMMQSFDFQTVHHAH